MSKKKKIAIMTVAQNISKVITDRYQKCVELSGSKYPLDIFFMGQKNPRDSKTPFNKCKLLNRGIKKLHDMGYEFIIQSDIDLIVPPKLIDTTYEVSTTKNICFYNFHRRIDPKHLPTLPDGYHSMDWEKYSKFETESANGCWNGMSTEMWMRSGGYNENMIEWGKEDDAFRRTASKHFGIGFLNYNKFCLIHVNHAPRTKDMRKRNQQCEIRNFREGKINWLI